MRACAAAVPAPAAGAAAGAAAASCAEGPGVRACFEGPEIVPPDLGWTGLGAVRVANREREMRPIPVEASPEGVAAAAAAAC